MTALEAVQNVQFVTVKQKRFAVIEAEEWESLVEWLERLEDLQIFQDSYDALAQVGGSRQRAGWKRWEGVRDEIA